MITDPEGNQYNPNGVVHNLGAAAFNILMMEAYRDNYFNAEDEIVLPELPVVTEKESEEIVGNYATAHLWKLWKAIDEKTRFLGGQLTVVQGNPTWIDPSDRSFEAVETSLEFEANIDMEGFAIIAGEWFDERQRQAYFRLIAETNLSNRVAPSAAAAVALPPTTFLSLEEGHAIAQRERSSAGCELNLKQQKY